MARYQSFRKKESGQSVLPCWPGSGSHTQEKSGFGSDPQKQPGSDPIKNVPLSFFFQYKSQYSWDIHTESI